MRIDVNVSVAPAGSTVHGTRCEIKNLNSIRSMVDAIGECISLTALFLANIPNTLD